MIKILIPRIEIGFCEDDFAKNIITVQIFVHKTRITQLTGLDLWRISHRLNKKYFIRESLPGIYKYINSL